MDIGAKGQGKWKLWAAVAGLGALGAALLYCKFRRRHPDEAQISHLRKLIEGSFEAAEPVLCQLLIEKSKVIVDKELQMLIHYISRLENKDKVALSATRNPFLPPFEKGIMITELAPGHRLLYNKFYFFRYHLLVVTQEFEEQGSRISLEDMRQTLLVTEALRGLFFFNSGPESGFSQKHKHLQILPDQALKLPIIQKILADINDGSLLQTTSKFGNTPISLFQGFEFIHGLVVAPAFLQDRPNQQASKWYLGAYLAVLAYLSGLLKNSKFSYNVIGCRKFILVVPRKGEKVMNSVGVNAICFMGSMLIKDQKLFEQVEHLYKPSDVLREITFTELPK